MNEITSVATNGSWVTTIMKIRAGSSGARRAQSRGPAQRSGASGLRGWWRARHGRVPRRASGGCSDLSLVGHFCS